MQGCLSPQDLTFPKAERDKQCPCLVVVVFCLFVLFVSFRLIISWREPIRTLDQNKQTKNKNNQTWASLITFSYGEGQIFRAYIVHKCCILMPLMNSSFEKRSVLVMLSILLRFRTSLTLFYMGFFYMLRYGGGGVFLPPPPLIKARKMTQTW